MNNWQALYYPTIEPPMKWLRSAALFFESVRSFVPADSDKLLSEEILRFTDATAAWSPYRPDEQTASLMDLPDGKLELAFSAIATSQPSDRKKITITIERGGKTSFANHVFMHRSKLTNRVIERLKAHGLTLSEEWSGDLAGADWFLIDERASDFILSYIADKLAAHQGWTSITDDEACFVFNAVQSSECQADPPDAKDQIARMMVTELVPDVVETLALDKYCELRKRYGAIRDKLAVFINEMTIKNRLDHIHRPEELRDAVQESVRELREEVVRFRESKFGRAFRRWGPFTLSSLVTLVATQFPEHWAALSLGGASVLFSAVDKAGVFERAPSSRTEMVRLLAAGRAELIGSLDIKRYLVP